MAKTASELKIGATEEKSKPPPLAQQTPAKSYVGGLNNPSAGQPRRLDNPFTPENHHTQISLSIYNRPRSMANKRPHTSKTVDELISRLPGWKPPAVPVKKGEEEPEPVAVDS